MDEYAAYALPRPGILTALGIMWIVNGFWNVLLESGSWMLAGLSLYGIGVLVTVWPATYAFGIGLWEIFFGFGMTATPAKRRAKGALMTLAILECAAILWGDVFSLACGVVALVALSQPQVKAYLGLAA